MSDEFWNDEKERDVAYYLTTRAARGTASGIHFRYGWEAGEKAFAAYRAYVEPVLRAAREWQIEFNKDLGHGASLAELKKRCYQLDNAVANCKALKEQSPGQDEGEDKYGKDV